jgi:hypothetical protein
MLVLHCCFHVYLAHRLHDEFQVSGLLQHASAEVMPATIQDELLRQTGLRSSLPELERHRSQMSRTCSFRWERLAHAFHKQNDGCPSALMVSTSRPAFAIAARIGSCLFVFGEAGRKVYDRPPITKAAPPQSVK